MPTETVRTRKEQHPKTMAVLAMPDPGGSHGLPSSVHTEITVLGAMLLDAVAISDATARLLPDDFALDSAQPAGERLHVLAAAEPLDSSTEYGAGGALMLCQALRQRYNFVIADAGARQLPFARDLQLLAELRVIIVDPTSLAVRNFEKISQMMHSAGQLRKPTVVLNFADRAGGLSQARMEQMLGLRFAAVIPIWRGCSRKQPSLASRRRR